MKKYYNPHDRGEVQALNNHGYNEVFEFLDGKKYTLDGIEGKFSYELLVGLDCWVYDRLYHEPTEKGKQSKEYREKRRQYRDDWVTDLTDSIEEYCDIAYELG
ncbi:MAG: hypothetical protein GWN31_15770, partial [Candidatus Thorarchaeota archaeon]|nr:hypothetical protein [Candidatus Thorarchaeota archaeon]NIW15343.1 hypothetical protein [Candidatus Thorarchaeota archaeon]NIW53303.1 hypothetical protein [Candidatus Korarchaeota archaeon]